MTSPHRCHIPSLVFQAVPNVCAFLPRRRRVRGSTVEQPDRVAELELEVERLRAALASIAVLADAGLEAPSGLEERTTGTDG